MKKTRRKKLKTGVNHPFLCVDKVILSLRYAKPVLIVVEGAQTSAGGRDREDPAGRKPEEASGPPAKSEAPGTKINSRMQI